MESVSVRTSLFNDAKLLRAVLGQCKQLHRTDHHDYLTASWILTARTHTILTLILTVVFRVSPTPHEEEALKPTRLEVFGYTCLVIPSSVTKRDTVELWWLDDENYGIALLPLCSRRWTSNKAPWYMIIMRHLSDLNRYPNTSPAHTLPLKYWYWSFV